MRLNEYGRLLVMHERPLPVPQPGELRVKVGACGVCRTDLHVVDGELPNVPLPLIPGHEIVGYVEEIGPGVTGFELGERVGIPWLGHTCGHCAYCLSGHENLCDRPQFTGYTRDGGYATHAIADADFAFALKSTKPDQFLAPFLCAGLIGWRSLRMAGDAKSLGLYGFGAAAHIIAQVANGRAEEFSLSRGKAMRKRKPSPEVLALSGRQHPMRHRLSPWMPPLSLPPSAHSFRKRSSQCARAAASSVRVYI